ncbi:MAG: thiamine biosynthesis protein ThiS [Candidatus Saganbacteria bacterium]|uniref:Thiamine-phosphate synthase n=1 Tax=Candidatus Saganbacteria bacterium TaxID=2575572 RepID=A0A833NXD4_UNCSA|nr:MAG: thiamine biosynthesis protein ThiS [Candidatus Saganbacteria bacterium]
MWFENQVYVISDSVDTLIKAINDGAEIIQFRDKSRNLKSIQKKAQELISYKTKKHFIFILNDYPELAAEIGADGVHIGQDTSSVKARKIVGSNLILGKSTHSLEQGLAAQSEGVNYISVGPVFPTPTKPGQPAIGLKYVRFAAANINIPFVVIGGIDLTNINEVIKAGGKWIGVVRAADQVPQLLKILERFAGEGNETNH